MLLIKIFIYFLLSAQEKVFKSVSSTFYNLQGDLDWNIILQSIIMRTENLLKECILKCVLADN